MDLLTLWNSLLVHPIINLTLFAYSLVHDFGLAIILVTVLIRLALYPLYVTQIRSQRAMQEVAPAMEELKKAGYWLVGLDETADKTYTQVDYTSPVGIVLGGEGKGLHELTRKRCDFVVSLPTTGPVKSLNVSVAAGVVLFEAIRQRNTRTRGK